jgi:hypothetical protein
LHVENYKDALANQQKSIDIQAAAVKRQKITLAVAAILLVAALAYLAKVVIAAANNSFHFPYHGSEFSFAFSAQKSHVKPKNHLSNTNKTRSSWRFRYAQLAILDI